jgi:hypothetical protein
MGLVLNHPDQADKLFENRVSGFLFEQVNVNQVIDIDPVILNGNFQVRINNVMAPRLR